MPDTQTTLTQYKNGPYLVLSDNSTFDGAEDCYVAYVTDDAEQELEGCSDFKAVEPGEMMMITLSDLLDAYNQLHGTNF